MHRTVSRYLLAALVLMAAVITPKAASAQDYYASGQLSWTQVDWWPTGYRVQFQLDVVVQLFGPPPANLSTLGPVTVNFGDGTTSTVSPVVMSSSYTGASNIDRAVARVQFTHDYPNPGSQPVVRATLCCRSPTLGDGNAQTPMQLTAAVSIDDTFLSSARTSSPPVVTSAPITRCGATQNCTVPISELNTTGSAISYRLATPAESGMAVQTPGTIDPATGVFTLTPAGLGVRTQVQVVAQNAAGSSSYEFTISSSSSFNSPPTITSPACGTTITYEMTQPVTFPVTIAPDPGTTVYLYGQPDASAVLTSTGTPGSYTFNYSGTGLGVGNTIMQFAAVSAGGQANCFVTLVQRPVHLIFVSGVIRDFGKTATDFASADGDAGTPLVAPTLGSDSKPVFAPGGATATVSSAASFNQWWNSTTQQVFSVTMNDGADPNEHIFSYGNNAFYPIDNALLGNQGDAHNNYFTYEVHTYLTYTPGDSLTFTSADDLWVFVDKTLALDLGGVHAAETGTIHMDDLRSNGQPLVAGLTYRVDLFYAHRGASHAPAIGLQLPPAAVCDILPGTPVPSFSTSDLVFLGSAVPSSGAAQLVHAGQSGPSGGAVWGAHNGTPMLAPVGDGFATEFDVHMAGPGEGLAFVMQTSSPSARGGDGPNMDYAGIDHSLAVEFDAHQDSFLFDPAQEHVAVQSTFDHQNSAVHTASSSGGAELGISIFDPNFPLTFEDGKRHHVRIEFRPGPPPLNADGTPAPAGTPRYGWMYVYVDRQPGAGNSGLVTRSGPVTQAQVDSNFLDRVLLAGGAYLGFTSAIGSGNSTTTVTISNWTVETVPPNAAASFVMPPAAGLAGQPGAAVLNAVTSCGVPDFYGQFASGFAATMTKGTHAVPTTIADHGDGTYGILYTPDAEGLWTLGPSFNGSAVGYGPVAVTVNANTTLAATPVTGAIGQPVTLSAQLTRTFGGTPIANASISFTLGALQLTATTDTNGRAQAVAGALPSGVTQYQANYAGSAAAFLNASTSSATVTATNTPPSLQPLGGPFSTTEGPSTNFVVAGSFTDPDSNTWSGTVNYGDGTVQPLAINAQAFALTHAYHKFGTYTVSVTVNDNAGGSDTKTTTVNVADAPPVISAFTPPSNPKVGVPAVFSVTFADPGSDNWTATVNFGDGPDQVLPAGPGTMTFSHTYMTGSPTPLNVKVTIADDGGLSDSRTNVVSVSTPASNLNAFFQIPPTEGGNPPSTLTITIDNPALQPLSGSVAWGDGASMPLSGAVLSFSPQHAYAQSGPITVVVTLSDTIGDTLTKTLNLNVNNVPPAIAFNPNGPASRTEGNTNAPNGGPGNGPPAISRSVTITDPAGAADGPFTVVVDFGDGSPVQTINGLVYNGATPPSFPLTHTYSLDPTPPATPYVVTVTATDKDGGQRVQTFTVGVSNLLPQFLPSGGQGPIEMLPFAFSGIVVDPGPNDGPWSATVDFGDGTGPQAMTFAAAIPPNAPPIARGSFSVSHTFAHFGDFTLTVQTSDKFGTGTQTFPLHVAGAFVSIAATPNPGTINAPHGTLLFTGSAVFTDQTLTTDGQMQEGVVWSSSNPAVATVDQTGLATAVGLGSTTITLSADFGVIGTKTATATLNVVDNTAPALSGVVANISTEATSAAGAAAAFTLPTATDDFDPHPVVSADHAPGTFPLGTTTVTVTATDAAGNHTSNTFTVTVSDTTKPVVNVPAPIVVTGTVRAGALVTFTASATDIVDGAMTPTCLPASGATFAVGATTVTCSATDAHQNTASASFVVTVVASKPPKIADPNQKTAEATGPDGAIVTFAVTATDPVDGAITPTCAPASGSTFPLGVTTVTCSVTDSVGLSTTDSFPVTVRDTKAPVLTLPGHQVIEATGPAGATAFFEASALDVVDGNVQATCTPASGSTFPLGKTAVTCSATDHAGNTKSGTFNVTVRDTTPPSITNLAASPSSLDPNGQMTTVMLSVAAIDITDPSPSCLVTKVTSNIKDVDHNGVPDWAITGPLTVSLEAATTKLKDRQYHITVRCTDASGNAAKDQTVVVVSHLN